MVFHQPIVNTIFSCLTIRLICNYNGYVLFVTDVVTNGKEQVTMARNSQFAIALHILTLLAQADREALTSEYMAGSVNTNPVFIRRVLGKLARAGLATSQPGVGGGWQLLHSPDCITLLDAYCAVEDDRLLSLHHSLPNAQCPVGRNIQRSLLQYFDEAEHAFTQTLAQYTVAQLLQNVTQDASA
jgi:Rrf2 family protein